MSRSPNFLTSRQFADSIGVSESSVKRWVDDGTIKADRTAGGHRRIPVAAAISYIRDHGVSVSKPQALSFPTTPEIGPIDEDAVEALRDAMLHDRAAECRAIIAGRYLVGARVGSIADNLISPVLRELGEIWLERPEGILLEHRAVDTCIHVLTEIGTWLGAGREFAPAAVTAGAPEDPYLLAPMLASLVLREAGIRATNLGPHTPLETISLAMARYGARLGAVSFSAPISPRFESAWRTFRQSAERMDARIVVGGRGTEAMPLKVRDGVRVCSSMSELADYATGWVEGAGSQRSRRENRA